MNVKHLKEVYQEKDREIKRQVERIYKKVFVDGVARDAEQAARNHDSRKLFQVSKQLCKKPRFSNSSLVKSKEGERLTDEDAQRARWAEHFSKS